MKKILVLAIIAISLNYTVKAQEEGDKLKVIAGLRLNPFVLYDFDGNKTEIMRIHAEVGALFNKRIYTSVGYTPFANAIYNFNEYWFIGFDKKLPVSWVIAAEYMIDDNKFIFQTGANLKLGKIGNGFVFLFTPLDNLNWGLKVGAFIPLNVVLMKK